MKKSQIMLAALGTCAIVALGAGPASADKCIGAKLKAIGKKERGLLSCQAKVATKGTAAVEPACDSKAIAKFDSAYDKPGACSAPLNVTCEMIADDCRDKVRAALPDGSDVTPSKCEASRLKAAGKKAGAKLTCYAKASAKSQPVDANCLSKAEAKFTSAFNKVTGCTGDGNATGIEAIIDTECVDQLVTLDGGNNVVAICPPPAATTTTTGGPATTTTSAAPTTTTTTGGATTTTAAGATTTTTGAVTTTTESTTTTTAASTTTTTTICDVCTAGPPLTPGCDGSLPTSCVSVVCSNDPSCCTDAWDSICVGEACSACGAPCPGTPCNP
jgi:hypothetical protein